MNRHEIFKADLHAAYLPYYDALCKRLGADWQPIDGYRTFATQDKLFAKGRTEEGSIVTKASGGLSFHNYGLATDWAYFPGGKYTPIEAEDPKWNEYTQACNDVGLRTLSWEKPHNEVPLKCSIKKLLEVYQTGNMTAVNQLIRESL